MGRGCHKNQILRDVIYGRPLSLPKFREHILELEKINSESQLHLLAKNWKTGMATYGRVRIVNFVML